MMTNAIPKRIPWGSQTPDGQVLLSMPWEVFVFGVSMLSIVNMLLALFMRNPDVEQVVVLMDSALLAIFVIDFLRRLHVAEDDRAYIGRGQGWLDLISIVPLLRIARVLRMLRTIRVVRRMGGVTPAAKAFFVNRASGSLYVVILTALLVMEFGSILVLWAERAAEGANILTASDALWYSLVTMSTVGYGDRFPVSDLGRMFGALTIIVGVGVFGTLTGFLANAFLSPSKGQGDAPPGPTTSDADSVEPKP